VRPVAGALLPPLAALALGAAAVAAFAPLAWYPLAWLAAGGLFLLLRRAASPRAGLLLGFAFGLGHFLAGTSWVYVSMSVFGGLPPALAGLATVLFCAYLALFPALAGVLFVRLRRLNFAADAVSFAALWVLAEWLGGDCE
jgi:apolipoprotein N-acyltransferase